MWVFRTVGLIYLGGAVWQRALSEAAWAGVGVLALGALLATVLERRSQALGRTLFGLLVDNALTGALLWLLGGAVWAYWLLLVPLFHALFRSGAAGALLGGVAGAGTV
ncbi:MAG: hypothetical protein ACK4UU_09425, partial [Fimbriimonadales bacterium]